ncbi:MAG: hypothetical protein KAI40_01515 [Desulfobacterales bacterium]|nr:hypothetical protein [Desulfobacterales bacterium]
MTIIKTSNRYYLNGIDWVMAALNMLNIKRTGIGNHSQLVLVLKGYLDQDYLGQRLSLILSKSPFLKGRVKRAWHLAPYWISEQQSFDSKDMRFFKITSGGKKDLDSIIQDCARTPFKDDKTLLDFDLIHFKKQTYLIMRFDHKMFDARGAEALLEYILDKQNHYKEYNLPSQGANLHSWKSRFLSGQCINRFLRSIYSKKTKVVSLKQNNNKEQFSAHNFYYTTFSNEQTRTIDDNTINSAGYLMNGVYILSIVAKAFDSLFKKHKYTGKILIPINVDVREAKFNNEKIFFNNLSFMLFKLKQGLSTKEYIKILKTQFIDQIKNKIPFHFINASLLMRIMPLKTLAFYMNLRMKKKPCSFSFSYIAEQAFNLTHIQNLEVVNLFHMPLVPINPGVGVFFTRFNNKLNMIISSYENTLTEKDGKFLQEKIISGTINGKA